MEQPSAKRRDATQTLGHCIATLHLWIRDESLGHSIFSAGLHIESFHHASSGGYRWFVYLILPHGFLSLYADSRFRCVFVMSSLAKRCADYPSYRWIIAGHCKPAAGRDPLKHHPGLTCDPPKNDACSVARSTIHIHQGIIFGHHRLPRFLMGIDSARSTPWTTPGVSCWSSWVSSSGWMCSQSCAKRQQLGSAWGDGFPHGCGMLCLYDGWWLVLAVVV